VDEKNNRVVIAEAKYRDFSPSSISGITLVKQELLDEDRLLDWASDTQRRLDFFWKHGERFEKELPLKQKARAYQTSAFVITKHEPLISKYKSVRVVEFYEFCKIFKTNEEQ
jgi:hypothetical protein